MSLKVKGLTHGFRPFLDPSHTFEIRLKYESLGQRIYTYTGFNGFTTSLGPHFKVEKCHQKVKGLTHGFRPFLDPSHTFEIRLKYESLGQGIYSYTGFNRFRRSFGLLSKVEKYHQKVKGLTHDF